MHTAPDQDTSITRGNNMKLFSPEKIGNLHVKNRLVMTAMGCGLAQENGIITDEFIAYYEARAKGGVGLIITEVACVDPVHGVRASRQIHLDNDEQIPMLKKLTDTVHRYGTCIFPQLHHPGVMSSCRVNGNEPLVSPSGVASRFIQQPARELTVEEIQSIVRDFAKAALRAKQAGFDGVEVHGAHHYLIHQFLSPHFNKRTDLYGGCFENRSRFLREIVVAIREAVGREYPLSVRISAEEFFGDEGYHLDEGILLAQMLEGLGVDLINVSAGGTDTGKSHTIEPISYREGWRSYILSTINRSVGCRVVGTTVIRTPEFAEHLLETGVTDFIGMARPFLADPQWANKVMADKTSEIRPCISCLYCIDNIKSEIPIACAVNPQCGHEMEALQYAGSLQGKNCAVVGGGVAGMEAACCLAERGASVTLYEKSPVLGGQVELASHVPGKSRMKELLAYYEQRMERAGVLLKRNTIVGKDNLPEADLVINASGAEPWRPGFLGEIHSENLLTPVDVLSGRVVPRNSNIIIIGTGMTGLETAEYLTEYNNHITFIEMADQIAPGANRGNVTDIMQRLQVADTVVMLKRKLLRIEGDTVHYENMQTGQQLSLPADYIVLSLGVRNINGLQQMLERGPVIGDAQKPGRIRDAVRSAYVAAMQAE